MLATDSPTNITVNITWKNGVGPNQTVVIDNTMAKEIAVPYRLDSRAIKLSAHTEFVAYTMHIAEYTSDGTCLYPEDVLGTDYTILTGYSNDSIENVYNPNQAEFSACFVYVIIPSHGTNVTVNFPNGTVQSYAGDEMDILTLRYQSDPSGTRVRSDKNVAVFAGQMCLHVPDGCDNCHQVYEAVSL